MGPEALQAHGTDAQHDMAYAPAALLPVAYLPALSQAHSRYQEIVLIQGAFR